MAVAGEGRAAGCGDGFDAGLAFLFSTWCAEELRTPQCVEAVRWFHGSREAQAILEKNDFRTSHLVDGTIMAKYLKQNKVQLQEAKDSIAFYLQGEDSGLEFKEELTKMLKQ